MSRLELGLWAMDFVISGVAYLIGGPYPALLSFFVAGLLTFIAVTRQDESAIKATSTNRVVDYVGRAYVSTPRLRRWHKVGLGTCILGVIGLVAYHYIFPPDELVFGPRERTGSHIGNGFEQVPIVTILVMVVNNGTKDKALIGWGFRVHFMDGEERELMSVPI